MHVCGCVCMYACVHVKVCVSAPFLFSGVWAVVDDSLLQRLMQESLPSVDSAAWGCTSDKLSSGCVNLGMVSSKISQTFPLYLGLRRGRAERISLVFVQYVTTLKFHTTKITPQISLKCLRRTAILVYQTCHHHPNPPAFLALKINLELSSWNQTYNLLSIKTQTTNCMAKTDWCPIGLMIVYLTQTSSQNVSLIYNPRRDL